MTRKEALSIAIQALSGIEQNVEAVDVLRTMREELPLNRWSEAAIRDSIEQFVLDHRRLPEGADFKNDRTLPSHTVIKNKFGVNLSEWLVDTYPDILELQKKARAAATERFVQEYHRLQPKSAVEFDRGRVPDCCCWYTIAGYNETNTWRALLAKLELPVFSNVAVPKKKREYYVQFEANLDNMQPFLKDVLRSMIAEGHPALPTKNLRSVLQRDEKDPTVEHFVLRYVTDKRLEYEAERR